MEVVLRRLCILLCLKQAYIRAIGQPIGFDWSRLEFNIENDTARGDQLLLKGWAMLADECPNPRCFGVPLVRPPLVGGRDPRKVSMETQCRIRVKLMTSDRNALLVVLFT